MLFPDPQKKRRDLYESTGKEDWNRWSTYTQGEEKTAEERRPTGGRKGKESSCSTVFSKANWDELPTGSLTLVTRH